MYAGALYFGGSLGAGSMYAPEEIKQRMHLVHRIGAGWKVVSWLFNLIGIVGTLGIAFYTGDSHVLAIGAAIIAQSMIAMWFLREVEERFEQRERHLGKFNKEPAYPSRHHEETRMYVEGAVAGHLYRLSKLFIYAINWICIAAGLTFLISKISSAQVTADRVIIALLIIVIAVLFKKHKR